MNDLSSDAKSLVHAAREEAGLSAEERARIRARVLSAASTGAIAVAGTATAKVAAAKAFGMSAMGWLAIGTSLTAVGVGAVYAFTRSFSPSVEMATRRDRAPITAPASESHGELPFVAPATTSVSTTNSSATARASRGAPVEPKARTTPAPSADAEFAEFAEDARLLRDVRAALAAGQAERALSLLEARATNSASGMFAEEREAARVVTLCKLGRRAEASAAASQFLAQHGSSPLGERVRRACPPEERDGARR